jgi:hypothetical protein
MKHAIASVLAILVLSCALAGQRPADDFPIVEKQYRNGSRTLSIDHPSTRGNLPAPASASFSSRSSVKKSAPISFN